MTDKHAVLSPSSAHRWSMCVAAPLMERDRPNKDSEASSNGTAAHELAALCLDAKNQGFLRDASSYVGRKMTNGVEVTDDMATDVQGYVDYVRALAKNAKLILVEHAVDISHITHEDGAEGTADCIMLMQDDELVIVDYKNGFRPVDPTRNVQLAMYASGAMLELEPCYDINGLRTVVYQPQHGGAKEYQWNRVEFAELIDHLELQAASATAALNGLGKPEYHPGPKQCEWCKAKVDCTAYQAHIEAALDIKFEEITDEDTKVPVSVDNLGRKLDIVPMLRGLCDAIEATANIELQAGREVLGSDGPYKLVKGKMGARKWIDENEAEAVLKGMRLTQDVMYDKSLISPTTAEKRAKAEKISKKQWEKIQPLITRTEGKPRVAKATEPGEAIKIETDEEMFQPIVDNPT